MDSNNNEDDTENSNDDTDSQDEIDVQSEVANKQRKRKHSAGTDITDRPEPLTKIKKKQTSKADHTDNVRLDASVVKSSNTSLTTPKKMPSEKISESDSDNTDKKKEHDRKRKHSGSLRSKAESIKDNTDGNMVTIGEKIKGDNSSVKKRRKSDPSDLVQTSKKEFKTVIQVRKDKKKNNWTETPMEDTEKTENKTDSANFSNDHTASQPDGASNGQSKTDEIQSSKGENSISESPKNKKRNQKNKKSALNSVEEPSDENDVKSDKKDVPDNKTDELETSKTKPPTTEELQDGEIEIWVPNKKYKGNKPTGSTFAKFEKTKAPAAFVKKALTKMKKQSISEGKVKDDGSSSMKGSTGSAAGKKVKFDMKKNKALGM